MSHRELRRVPLDFSWPIGTIWKGFLNPHPGPSECLHCNGSGYNEATRKIADGFYDFEGHGTRWCDAITQDEVLALVEHGRLYDFTHAPGPDGWQQRTWETRGFWCPVCMTAVPQLSPMHAAACCTACQGDMVLLAGNDIRLQLPRAEEVNRWQRGRGFGHDAINRFILIETRAKRLGVWGQCPKCHGRGENKLPRKMKKRYRNWQEFDPPIGDGYQLWETCTEGSPVSPVFATTEGLARWCARHATLFSDVTANYDQWLKMFSEEDGVEMGNMMIFTRKHEDPRHPIAAELN